MRKLIVTTALAAVLAGSAYAQGHHGGGGGGMGGGGGGGMGGGGGGGSAAHVGGGGGPGFSGGGGPSMMSRGGSAGPSMMSRGTSGPSNFSNGPGMTRGSQFSRTNQGPQGRTVYNQERGNRNLYNRYEGENRNRFEGREGNRFEGREGNRFANREGNRFEGRNEAGNHGIHVGHANINEFRHGINNGNFFVHGRHFGFRRFWNGQWVFLTGWDACTAWVWVAVAPGVFAWAPIDVCIG